MILDWYSIFVYGRVLLSGRAFLLHHRRNSNNNFEKPPKKVFFSSFQSSFGDETSQKPVLILENFWLSIREDQNFSKKFVANSGL